MKRISTIIFLFVSLNAVAGIVPEIKGRIFNHSDILSQDITAITATWQQNKFICDTYFTWAADFRQTVACWTL